MKYIGFKNVFFRSFGHTEDKELETEIQLLLSGLDCCESRVSITEADRQSSFPSASISAALSLVTVMALSEESSGKNRETDEEADVLGCYSEVATPGAEAEATGAVV